MKYSTHSTYINEEGTEVPSATTILKILNKPFLTKWANFMGFKRRKVEDILQESSEIGTAVHEMIECFLMKKPYIMKASKYYTKSLLVNYLDHFISWKNAHVIIPEFMEKKFESKRYGGTVDFYGEVDGKKTILDFKTSKRFYSSMFLQLAAYVQMLEEKGYVVEQVAIVRVNADKCETRFMDRKDLDRYMSVFNTLVDLFHQFFALSEEDGWGNILDK